ncbi:hypothetical protein [Cohnella nanjingensis]|uniref:Uncharacterized protein n=1 Tax=Cohnella nanjingensis TaxID=1387779 RepID=A0A7X0VJH4_9BACL|nr:hypothetical protein [Cohnella nanjingensis]MBB6675578.1 hypothetical protein [Cohnella nanjingensis]
MEQLINLILKNLPIILVVLGILFSLLRRSPLEKPQRPGQPARPAGRMPDFGGGGFPRPPQRPQQAKRLAEEGEAERPAATREPYDSERPPAAEMPLAGPSGFPAPDATRGATSDAYGSGAGPSADGATGERYDAYAAPVRPKAARTSSRAGEGALRGAGGAAGSESALTRDDLARAVMWAEILGPPRSRKPHRR